MRRLLSAPRRIAGRVRRRVEDLAYRVPSPRRALEDSLVARLTRVGIPAAVNFDFASLKSGALRFVESLAVEPGDVRFRYSASVRVPTLYASVYALLVHSLYGAMGELAPARRDRWKALLDAHQSAEDGLFRDPAVECPGFRNGDWWGDRHLAGHVIMAYAALGARPPHSFRFLRAYDTPDKTRAWLDDVWRRLRFDFASNEIMNVAMLLQYERDTFDAGWAAESLRALFDGLRARLRPDLGVWWNHPPANPLERSWAIQGAYHLHPLFLYDEEPLPGVPRMLEQVLLTQNRLGGFGVQLNASGCEDIDSIYPLVKFADQAPDRAAVRAALARSLAWVLANRNDDGGFTWIRGRAFTYGHPAMSSAADESELFGTWFRTLSLAFLAEGLGLPHGFRRNRCPGYEV